MLLAGLAWHKELNCLVCRLCRYLVDFNGLGHCHSKHNDLIQAGLDLPANSHILTHVCNAGGGQRHTGTTLTRAAQADVQSLHAAPSNGVEEHKSRDGEPPQVTLPRSRKDVFNDMAAAARAGKPLPPILGLSLYNGKACTTHGGEIVVSRRSMDHHRTRHCGTAGACVFEDVYCQKPNPSVGDTAYVQVCFHVCWICLASLSLGFVIFIHYTILISFFGVCFGPL